ncbi:hypothetical protein L6452_44476 [Arctium lappa]|uniref:Uncharacterized protein n=1 Tax=Arctium lappa TaxID=4217 RepID=A0ACB8XG01_ARCLA|nr:hypothetical protein L6452_44476 [Arctium lappa]
MPYDVEESDEEGKELGTTKDLKNDAKPEKKKASGSSGSTSKLIEKAKGKVKESGKERVQSNTVMVKKGGVETIGEGDNSEKINQIEVAPVQTTGSGKKKVIRKVVKKKVVEKDKAGKAAEQSDPLVPKKMGETTTNTEAAGRDEESSGNPSAVKTFTRKKVTKKVPVAKVVKKEDEGTQAEVIPVKEQESSENKPKNADAGSASGKTTVKKKIIKRVTKRKVVAKVANSKDKVAEEAGITIGEQSSTLGNKESEVKLESN